MDHDHDRDCDHQSEQDYACERNYRDCERQHDGDYDAEIDIARLHDLERNGDRDYRGFPQVDGYLPFPETQTDGYEAEDGGNEDENEDMV